MSFNGDLNATDDGLELETKGQIHTYSTENTALNVGTDSYILSAASGETTGLEWVANTDAGLTLGAKGDIHTRSASDQAALAVGTNLKSLYANSAETTGLEWNTNARETLTAAGDILYASGANTLARLAKGSDTEVLTLASGVPSWAAAAGGGATVTTNEIHPTADFSTSSTSFVDATNYDTTIANETGGGFIASGIVGWYNTNNGSDNSSYKLVHGTTSQGITNVNNNFPKQGGTPISLPIEFMGSTDGNDLKIQAMVSMGTSTARGSGDFVHVSILEVA